MTHPEEAGVGTVIVKDWDPRVCTTDSAETFCGNCTLVEQRGALRIYRCEGHEILGPEGPEGGPELGGEVVPMLEPVPVADLEPAPMEPGEFDYYEVYPDRGAICCTHVEWRVAEWNPNDLPGEYTEADLSKRRLVEKEFATGGRDVVEDE